MLIFCEPQCYGFEHSGVNAALVRSALSAYPDEKAVLLAEKSHLVQVRKLLQEEMQARVEFLEIEIAPRRSSNIMRFLIEHKVYKRALICAKNNNSQKVIFLSVTSPGLVWLKWQLMFFPEIVATAVMHGIIETVEEWSAILKYELLFWFRFTLLLGNYDRIRYLVFGSFIKIALDQRFPSLSLHTVSMDLPYQFKTAAPHDPFKDNVVRFGALGVGSRSKGTDIFFGIAEKFGPIGTKYQPEFRLVGPLMDSSLPIPPGIQILSKDGRPLTEEEYDREAKALDYSVFCHRPTHYRYSTSAAFFDALSYGKPVIALRNPLFDYYFSKFGNIGYLCDSQEQMADVVLQILTAPSLEMYRAQRSNILKGREFLNTELTAQQFKSIWQA